MKNNKIKSFILILIVPLVLGACKKEGCTDENANNFNKEIKSKNDNNTCVYQSYKSIYLSDSVYTDWINKGVQAINLNYEGEIYTVDYIGDWLYLNSDCSSYKKNRLFNDLGKNKYDITYFELTGYVSLDTIFTIQGVFHWQGGVCENYVIN